LTLIEVLLSVVILAVGAVVIMQALVKISYAHTIVEDQTRASLLAMSKMAELELAVREGVFPEKGERGRERMGTQTMLWEATSQAREEDPTLAAVHVTISWRRGSAVGERQLDTLLRPPQDASDPSS